MNVSFINKTHVVLPVRVLSSSLFFLNTKCFILKYAFNKKNKTSFIKQIKYITTIYNIFNILLKRIKKSNIFKRKDHTHSTKKP